MTTRPKSDTAQAREAFAAGMTGFLHQLDAWLARVQIPGTPERAELSVRKGKRLAAALAKRAATFAQALDPEPWITAPTRERAAKGIIVPEVILDHAGNATGIRHRVQWPVQMMQQRASVTPRHILAGAWLRSAWDASRNVPATSNYSGVFAASNPTGRLPTTRGEIARQRGWEGPGHAPMAGEAVNFAWARLEDDLRATLWVLVLQEPLPSHSHTLSVVEFGRIMGKVRSEEAARNYALGMLHMGLSRLATIRQHWETRAKGKG